MIKKILVAIIVLLPPHAFAQEPKIPFENAGLCPFECCRYGRWIAKKNTTIYKEMSDSSPIAFKVRKGERVTAMTGVVVTTKFGIVKALKDFVTEENHIPVKAGDVVYLLAYQGEGYYLVWYKGKKYEEIFYEGQVEILREPETVWWVKIKNRRGQIGWSRSPENFGGNYGC